MRSLEGTPADRPLARTGRSARQHSDEQPLRRGVFPGQTRAAKLCMSAAELRRSWDAVSHDQLPDVAEKVFTYERHAGAFIAVEK